MIKTSLFCNSLKWSHFIEFLFSFKRRKGFDLFRKQLANFFSINDDRVFLFGSARMSIYSIIKARGWRKEDEIIVVGYTCVVVTNAISYTGLKAVYIDINEETLNIDTKSLDGLINERTKALIVSHNFGIVYEDIQEIKKKYPDIIIIEDAAHTFGSKNSKGEFAGLLGDASYFSLEYSKPITTGMGGILIVNNEELKNEVQDYYKSLNRYPAFANIKILISLTAHLFTSKKLTVWMKWKIMRVLEILGLRFKSSKKELDGEMPEHYPVKLGKNLAFIGYLQCRDIEEVNLLKAEIARNYSTLVDGIKHIKHYYHPNYNYVRYPILLDESVGEQKVNALKKALRKEGMMVGEWFNDVIHPVGSFRYCYNEGTCPNGESISKRILNFPVNIHTKLKEKDYQSIARILKEHLD